MKVLNYGSLNYDHVYAVDHMVSEGETLSSLSMETHLGGKGLNQSIALAKAGAAVYHGGMVGEDGDQLLEASRRFGVHTDFITRHPGRSGHAIIQVTPKGENAILLYQGANGKNSEEKVDQVLSEFGEEDILLLQNEINLLGSMIDKAYEKHMKIVLNPSPLNETLLKCDLKKVSLFILNKVEGEQLTGETEPEKILEKLEILYPASEAVLTLGRQGSIYAGKGKRYRGRSFSVPAVDTTAAGDTYTGYFLASVLQGKSIEESIKTASAASAIAVTRKGAVPSIPERKEVEAFLNKYL